MNAQLRNDEPEVYIGGGNVAGILGVSPYKTPLAEYENIVDGRPEDTAAREEFFERRRGLEPWAARLFTRRTGLAITHYNRRHRDTEHSFIQAEIDFEPEDGCNGEIKTVHPMAARDWGEPDTDECPVYVTAQAMHGLMVRPSAKRCYVQALIGFDDDRLYLVERDPGLIAHIRAKEVEFWDRVQRRDPPPPINGDDVMRMFDRDNGLSREADLEALLSAERLKQIKAEIGPLEVERELLADKVKVFLGEASTLTVEGQTALTWKSQNSRRFDQTAFAAAHPDLFEQFKHTTTTRVLRIK